MNALQTQKHSPGPWKVYDAGSDDNLRVEGIGSVCKVARKGPDLRNSALEYANARLISAAPELLEALESCLSALELEYGECDGCAKDPCTQCRSRVAIRKAKGEL